MAFPVSLSRAFAILSVTLLLCPACFLQKESGPGAGVINVAPGGATSPGDSSAINAEVVSGGGTYAVQAEVERTNVRLGYLLAALPWNHAAICPNTVTRLASDPVKREAVATLIQAHATKLADIARTIGIQIMDKPASVYGVQMSAFFNPLDSSLYFETGIVFTPTLETSFFSLVGDPGLGIKGTDTLGACGANADECFTNVGDCLSAFTANQQGAEGSLMSALDLTTLNASSLTRNSGYAVVVQPDYKILVAATKCAQTIDDPGCTQNVVVSRYTPDGFLDPTFATASGNFAMLPFYSSELNGLRISLGSDGKIVVSAADETIPTTSTFNVARLTTIGTLDTSFAGTGVVKTNIPGGGSAFDNAIQADGKIILAGVGRNFPAHPNQAALALVRYNADGSLDTQFGQAGFVADAYPSPEGITPPIVYQTLGRRVLVQANGAIVVGAEASYYNGTFNFLDRFSTTGVQDMHSPSIGNQSPSGKTDPTTVAGLVQNAQGETYLLYLKHGLSSSGGNTAGPDILKFDSKQILMDQSVFYPGGGTVDPWFTGAEPVDLVLRPDGRLVALVNTGLGIGLVALKPDGRLDSAFGNGTGKLTQVTGQSSPGRAVARGPDGRFIVVGETRNQGLGWVHSAISTVFGDGASLLQAVGM